MPASESIINDMGGEILSKVVHGYTKSARVWYVHILFVVQYSPEDGVLQQCLWL